MNGTIKKAPCRKPNPDDWVVSDMTARYGINQASVTNDFFAQGLPYYIAGDTYHFDPDEVKAWEIRQQYVPFGKRKRIILPEFEKYKTELLTAISTAENTLNLLQQQAKDHNIDAEKPWTVMHGIIIVAIALTICVACVLIF